MTRRSLPDGVTPPGLSIPAGWADIGGGLALGAVAAAFLSGALALPPSYNPADVGPGTFPLIAALATGLLSLAMILSGVSLLVSGPGDHAPMDVERPFRVLALLCLMLAYVVAMPLVGVYTTTALFVGAAVLLLGGRGLVQLGLPVALILLFLWIGFDTALNVVFPEGVLP